MPEPSGQSDLLTSAIGGDQAALTCLLLEHRRRLIRMVAARMPGDLRGAVSPEDVVQEAFIEAFRRIRRFEPRGAAAFGAWLMTIARNRLLGAIKARRAAKRGGGRPAAGPWPWSSDRSVATLLDRVAAYTHTPSRSAAGHEAAAILQVALAGLKAEYRDVLRLRYLEGLPAADVAKKMRRTEGAVRMLCGRAMKKVQEAMGHASHFFSTGP